jgi:hypothetical protein
MPLTEQDAMQRLADRRAAGVADLGAEVRQRIAELGPMPLHTAERRAAFSEIISAFEVAPYPFLLDPTESTISTNPETLHLKGLLVEALPGGGVQPVAQVERMLDFGAGTAEHVYLSVLPPYRGTMITPRLMLKSLELYDALGLARIGVHAGLESGRYYWAGHVGYDFADETQRRYVERWATFVLGALRAEHDLDGVEEPQQWALLGTEVEPPTEITFAELEAALPPRVPLALLDPNGTGVVGYEPAARVLADVGMVETAKHLRLIREGNALSAGDPVVLGKATMLTGPDWYGVFDLSDPVRRGSYEREARGRLTTAGIPWP